jgi:molybdopterin-guanine dinucleotide biosynthesis protein MobB
VRVVAIVGRSGSGKTTLLLNLIPELVRRGLKVGVAKRTHHVVDDLSKPGSDSERLAQTGALVTVLCGEGWASCVDGALGAVPGDWSQLIEAVSALGLDLFLIEGGKGSPFLKLEVARGQAPLLAPGHGVRAIVGDFPVAGLPLLQPDQVADFILRLSRP